VGSFAFWMHLLFSHVFPLSVFVIFQVTQYASQNADFTAFRLLFGFSQQFIFVLVCSFIEFLLFVVRYSAKVFFISSSLDITCTCTLCQVILYMWALMSVEC